MSILAIQTAEYPNSLALLEGSEVLGNYVFKEKFGVAEKIRGRVEFLFRKCKKERKDIDLVSVCIGPGSYTGLKVGLAFAKGLCQFSKIPIVGVDSLSSLAYGILKGDKDALVVPLMDAKHGRVYCLVDSCQLSVVSKGPVRIEVEEIRKTIKRIKERLKEQERRVVFIGSGAVSYKKQIRSLLSSPEVTFAKGNENVIKAENVGYLGLRKFEEKGTDDFVKLKPIYVLGAKITIPKHQAPNKHQVPNSKVVRNSPR